MRWLLLGLTASCASNRFNQQGDRQGRWHTYYDPANHQPQAVGRYRHNQPVGRWRYYARAGHLERQERFRQGGRSLLTYYYPSGRVWRKGRTRLADDGRALHYYWTGDWRVYDESGRLKQVDIYVLGQLAASRPVAP